jgi:hypothetical protein
MLINLLLPRITRIQTASGDNLGQNLLVAESLRSFSRMFLPFFNAYAGSSLLATRTLDENFCYQARESSLPPLSEF